MDDKQNDTVEERVAILEFQVAGLVTDTVNAMCNGLKLSNKQEYNI